MTLEQCKRRYQKATLATSKALVRYDKLLRKLWFCNQANEYTSALKRCRHLDFNGGVYYRFSNCIEGNRVFVTYRKRGNKITVIPADSAILEKAEALCDDIDKCYEAETELKFILRDEFGLSWDAIGDLRRSA